MNLLVALLYHGEPHGKKNRPRLFRRGRRIIRLPPADYEALVESACREIMSQGYDRAGLGGDGQELQVTAHFYVGARRSPDLVNLMDGCADLLESCGVVSNDYWIKSWDGSRLFRDPRRPRTEVLIYELEEG